MSSFADCGCPIGPGVRINDEAKHAEWHELVEEQTGLARGPINARTVRAARGYLTETLAMETIIDRRARESGKRASGEQRRAARGEVA